MHLSPPLGYGFCLGHILRGLETAGYDEAALAGVRAAAAEAAEAD